jgi:hypothetical protein
MRLTLAYEEIRSPSELTFYFGVLHFGARTLWFRSCILHALFQSTNTFSNAFAELWKFFRAEHQEGNKEDDQEMHRLKKTFKHTNLPQTRLLFLTLLKLDCSVNLGKFLANPSGRAKNTPLHQNVNPFSLSLKGGNVDCREKRRGLSL